MLPDHLPLLLDHCLAGLYVLSGDRIVWLNARVAEMVGCTAEELVGGSFLQFIHPPDLPLVRSKTGSADPYVVRAVRRDGELVHLEVHQRTVEKDGQRLISGAVLDVTARVRAESKEREKLQHDAFHDVLTGLPNRALFLDRLEHRLALEKRRHQTSFSVLVLDIDRFKVINDSLGHVRGDELLVEVARRLQSCLRPADTVARLSGDEFTILLEDVASVGDARRVADRLREELRVPFWLGAHEVFSGASVGIAHGSAAYAHPEDILRDACRQMKQWQERLAQPQLEIGVNLSSRQFQGPGLVAEVAEVLRETGLSPRSLRLEVTESLLMDKHPNVAQTMTELRAMGVRIDLDDFGTGYSSLSYLHQFPIDTLKIDRSFIHRIGASDDAVEIVNTILALANSLDMEVVAEGVETEEQLQQLRKMHCAYAQGYHLSRPVEAPQFETLIGTGRSWAAA